ncbi:ribonuclease P protein component [Candidatus Dojkabacteria bacterium]|uniref:Ribonuclease P protein component n=1 Tax=Candidatus Dojkabacteria bacterium TaxID=2099670 RepID=A0A955I597_9BACT|nr:ribonuclease P protein component [Candidatus Dojkabacteria bacterium]MCB9790948.1 ribonuclease P protein component [Candidatus Nomurabacteria bacterium]
MLNKQNRLNSARLFNTVYKYGRKRKSEYGMFVALLDKNYSAENPSVCPAKFGFIVKKKIGNAVQRHKMTRWLRELSREALKASSSRLDGLIISYIAFTLPASYQELKKDFEEALESLLKEYER